MFAAEKNMLNPWNGWRLPKQIVGNKAKGRFLKWVFQENKANFPCLSRGKKCSFFGKFGLLCFLETTVLRFALLPYYRRNDVSKWCLFFYYTKYSTVIYIKWPWEKKYRKKFNDFTMKISFQFKTVYVPD